jgi:hypothetical protein
MRLGPRLSHLIPLDVRASPKIAEPLTLRSQLHRDCRRHREKLNSMTLPPLRHTQGRLGLRLTVASQDVVRAPGRTSAPVYSDSAFASAARG